MIRFAQQSDTVSIRELWDFCFPDEGGFNSWYFEHLYRAEYTLLYEQDNVLAAMLQMLPFEMEFYGKIKPVTYIYGACTHPKYRRKHLMAQLLEESFRLDQEQQKAASILIPQEKWLFEFYRKFGYRVGFTVSTQKYIRYSSSNAVKACCLTDTDIEELNDLYSKISCPKPVRSKDFWETQLQLFQTIGAGAFGIRKQGQLAAAAFCWNTEQGLWIQELLCRSMEEGFQLADAIISTMNVQQCTITSAGNGQPLGCIKIYDEMDWKTGYFNLMFN